MLVIRIVTYLCSIVQFRIFHKVYDSNEAHALDTLMSNTCIELRPWIMLIYLCRCIIHVAVVAALCLLQLHLAYLSAYLYLLDRNISSYTPVEQVGILHPIPLKIEHSEDLISYLDKVLKICYMHLSRYFDVLIVHLNVVYICTTFRLSQHASGCFGLPWCIILGLHFIYIFFVFFVRFYNILVRIIDSVSTMLVVCAYI